MSLNLEMDEKNHLILLTLYKDMWFEECWNTRNWFEKKWKRIKGSIRLLFTGRMKISESFLFDDIRQIRDFLGALDDGMGQMKKNIENLGALDDGMGQMGKNIENDKSLGEEIKKELLNEKK